MTPGLSALVGTFVLASLIRLPIALSMFLAGPSILSQPARIPAFWSIRSWGMMTGIYVLFAIPMFILAANVMNDSGIRDRLWGLADALVGRLRGGTGHVTVAVSIIFSSMTGSAVTEAASPGVIAVKMMRQIGRYPIELAVAVTAAASVIATVILLWSFRCCCRASRRWGSTSTISASSSLSIS